MVDAVETKKCTLCDKDIEVAKFRMHEIGCQRYYHRIKENEEAEAKAEKEKQEAEAERQRIE